MTLSHNARPCRWHLYAHITSQSPSPPPQAQSTQTHIISRPTPTPKTQQPAPYTHLLIFPLLPYCACLWIPGCVCSLHITRHCMGGVRACCSCGWRGGASLECVGARMCVCACVCACVCVRVGARVCVL